MPNKWTGKEELYVVELSRNIEKFLDAFKEIPGKSVCVFRLFERIHQVQAISISYCALKDPLPESDQEALIKWISEVHMNKHSLESITSTAYPKVVDALEILTDKNLSKHQDLKELLSPDFINMAFRKTQRHLTVPDTGYPLQALDLIKSDSFKDPVPIRIREKDAPPELVNEAHMHPSNKRLSIYNEMPSPKVEVNFPSPPSTLRKPPKSDEDSTSNT